MEENEVGILEKETLYERLPFLKNYEDVSAKMEEKLQNLSVETQEKTVYAFKYSHVESDVNLYVEETEGYISVPSVKLVSTIGYSGAKLKDGETVHVFDVTNLIEPQKPDHMEEDMFKQAFAKWSQDFYRRYSFKDIIPQDETEDKERIDNIFNKLNEKLFLMEEELNNMGIKIF